MNYNNAHPYYNFKHFVAKWEDDLKLDTPKKKHLNSHSTFHSFNFFLLHSNPSSHTSIPTLLNSLTKYHFLLLSIPQYRLFPLKLWLFLYTFYPLKPLVLLLYCYLESPFVARH